MSQEDEDFEQWWEKVEAKKLTPEQREFHSTVLRELPEMVWQESHLPTEAFIGGPGRDVRGPLECLSGR